MKKVISLILALVLCLSLCACGTPGNPTEVPETTVPETTIPETTAAKGTPLTLDNYDSYLTIKVSAYSKEDGDHVRFSVQQYNFGYGMKIPGGYTWYLYPLLGVNANIKGASSNFNYYDVEVKVKVSVTYESGDPYTGDWKAPETFEKVFTIKCNIGGEGSNGETIDLGKYLHDDMLEYKWEVVEITGYVEKA